MWSRITAGLIQESLVYGVGFREDQRAETPQLIYTFLSYTLGSAEELVLGPPSRSERFPCWAPDSPFFLSFLFEIHLYKDT